MNPDCCWFFCWCSKFDWGGDWIGLNEFLIGGPIQPGPLGEKDDGAKGEVAILSEVDMLENIVNASGKLGGVAGVLAGVINCKKIIANLETNNI